MKNIQHIILFLAVCLVAIACKKNVSNGGSQANNLFTDTVATIKQGEPLLLSFSNGNNTTIVHWNVLPNSGYTISPVGVYATLSFSQAGVYTVLATANATQATYIVTVSDSLYSHVDTGFSLQASKIINVFPNEVVSFAATNPPIPTGFVWTSIGNVGYVNTTSNPAAFSFSNGVTGTVKVKVGNQIRSRTVWLADSINNPSVDTVPFIFSDKLIITPSVTKDINGNKILVLSASTQYNYQCSTDSVLSSVDSSDQQYTVSYGGVVMAAVPCAAIKPATTINTISNIPVGTYPFIVNFGNDTYTGTVSLSASGVYTFSWANNDRVVISPLVVE